MKKLSKITLVAAFAAFFAQSASAQLQFGVKVGGNLANLRLSDDAGEDIKSLVSFNAGMILEAPITETVGIRTGIEVQGKGAKSEFSEPDFSLKATISPIYVQVPVVVAYNGSMFFVGAGPYAAMGVAGKSRVKSSIFGVESDENEPINFGSKGDDDFSALDFGARIEAGLKLNKLRISANYDLGLANTIPKDDRDGESAQHGVIGISVGYMF